MALDEMDDAPVAEPGPNQDESTPARVLAHVNRIIQTIKDDKEHHDPAFKRMKADMFRAMKGRSENWSEQNYKANFLGRHVKTKTAALYAKNPKAVYRRAERLDFQIWDESPESLMMAFQTVQLAVQMQQQAASMPPTVDPETGASFREVPQMPPGFEEAQALIADFQQGTAFRQMVDKIGKTLEILFARALRDQEPVDFKTAAKQMVRRACTTGVGYVELGFVREMGERPGLSEQLADSRVRLDHLRRLMSEIGEGGFTDDDAEVAELEASIKALTTEPEIVLREGLVFDFPASTSVIPDRLCKSLVGFIGARHLTIEYMFTPEEVEEMFPGVDLKLGYQEYGPDGNSLKQPAQTEIPFDAVADMDDVSTSAPSTARRGLMRVWKHYDKPSGLVYYVADGYKGWLREPAPPDVFVEKFWPVFALTFNAVESEDELFPPSDVYLLSDQQDEHNRSRQGMREHRQAARPRWATRKGLLDDEDKDGLKGAKSFDVLEIGLDPSVPLEQALEALPVPGVDPNLYGTEQFFSDVQLVSGSQQSSYGGLAKATATESAIAANSTASTDGSSSDDLDNFLTTVARAASQILLGEMSSEQVKTIVGPGAVWPEMTLSEIASELFLEVEAGSSGRPNQAVEIDNFTKMAPYLLQIPGLSPGWLAGEAIRRLDDRIDLTKAVSAGVPSIMAQNQLKQIGTGNPTTDPNQQGGAGAQNAPAAPQNESPGGEAAFGSNQT
ncbi:hypothetical protein XM25_00625 [Devosia sp. H5989]|nr:hypothetical protein XM25_00625 [Devosia sp. H5989]